jgi:Ala-tRNA(Pro) deacylase
MVNTKEALFKRLEHLGIKTQTIEHPPAYSVKDAKMYRGELFGAHFKNLFLKDKKGQLWLVVCLEDRELNMKALKDSIGSAHLSFGKPDLLMETLGVAPGSVSPFSLINDSELRVQVVLDQEMMAFDYLNFHPLENTATTQISRGALLKFIKFCGHRMDLVIL